MSGKPALDISEAQWQIVRDILRRIVPARQVWAFGSRATRVRHFDPHLGCFRGSRSI